MKKDAFLIASAALMALFPGCYKGSSTSFHLDLDEADDVSDGADLMADPDLEIDAVEDPSGDDEDVSDAQEIPCDAPIGGSTWILTLQADRPIGLVDQEVTPENWRFFLTIGTKLYRLGISSEKPNTVVLELALGDLDRRHW